MNENDATNLIKTTSNKNFTRLTIFEKKHLFSPCIYYVPLCKDYIQMSLFLKTTSNFNTKIVLQPTKLRRRQIYAKSAHILLTWKCYAHSWVLPFSVYLSIEFFIQPLDGHNNRLFTILLVQQKSCWNHTSTRKSI